LREELSVAKKLINGGKTTPVDETDTSKILDEETRPKMKAYNDPFLEAQILYQE
jgi:hypothetical protein